MAGDDIPLTMDEAAAQLRMSRRWLQAFLKTIPPCYLKGGKKKLFDKRAMDVIRHAMRGAAMDVAPRGVGDPLSNDGFDFSLTIGDAIVSLAGHQKERWQ